MGDVVETKKTRPNSKSEELVVARVGPPCSDLDVHGEESFMVDLPIVFQEHNPNFNKAFCEVDEAEAALAGFQDFGIAAGFKLEVSIFGVVLGRLDAAYGLL